MLAPIDQVKRVRLSRGASPPGRRPRRTNRVAQAACPAMARRVSPRPSSCHLPDSPTTISPAAPEAPTTPSGPRGDEQRLRRYPDGALHQQGGARKQSAGVSLPQPRIAFGSGEQQRGPARARDPRTDLDRRPVVIGAPERHEHGAIGSRPETCAVPADEQRDVARCPVEDRGQIDLERLGEVTVRKQQVSVLLRCEPHEIFAGLAGRERDGSRGGSSAREFFAPAVEERRRGAHRLRRRQPGENHLARGPCAGEQLGEPDQRVEVVLGSDRDEDRTLGGRRFAHQIQIRILLKHRPLELLQLRARLDAELLDECRPRRLVGGKSFGLPARAVQGEHQLPPQPLPQRMLRDQPLELARRARRSDRLRGRRRSAAPGRRGGAPRAGSPPLGRTTRTRGRRGQARATAPAPRAATRRCRPARAARSARDRAPRARRGSCSRAGGSRSDRRRAASEAARRSTGSCSAPAWRAHPQSSSIRRSVETTSFGTGEQQGEQRPLALAAERKRTVGVDHLQGPKDPELHLSACSQRPLSPPAHLRTVIRPTNRKGGNMSVRLYTRIATRSPPLRWPPAPRLVRIGRRLEGQADRDPGEPGQLREPGSTGYVPKTALVTIPAAFQNLREPGSTGYVPTTRYDPGVARELPASRATHDARIRRPGTAGSTDRPAANVPSPRRGAASTGSAP